MGVPRQLGGDESAFGTLKLAIFAFSAATSASPSSATPGPGDDDRDDRLAEVGVRHADDRALGDAGQVVERGLDLGRVDVEAAADDQVLAAADDRDVAARVDLADVAGAKPAAVGELVLRLLGHAPVAREDVRAAHLDAADLAGVEAAALVVADPELDAGQREADRAAAPLAVASRYGFEVSIAVSLMP
jgi:hypothetical protein